MKTTSTNRKEKKNNLILRNGVLAMTIFMTTTVSFAQRTNGVNTISTEQIGAVEKNPIQLQQIKTNPVVVPVSMVPLCPSVTGFNMIDKSFDKVIFGWDGSSNFDSISIRYTLTGTTGYRTVTIPGTTTSGFYILQGLTPQTTYDFDISSVCNSGSTSSWSAPMTITTFAEPAPRLASNSSIQRNYISLKIIPNPATTSTVISFVAPVNSSNLVIITTTSGREIYKATEICTQGKLHFTYDVSALAPGLYFVRVYSGTTMSVERLIVQ